MKFILPWLFLSLSAWASPGQLVSVKHLADTPASVIPGARAQICPSKDKASTKTFGFKRYKVDYMTTDLKGNEVQSSGILMIPDAVGKFPMVVYQHGTVYSRRALPSSSPLYGEGDAIGFCFSSLGYVAVLADYLGYGDGTGVHPYLHADSEAWTARDMMRAANIALTQLKIEQNGKLFVTGYSQGGHAAMALLRALELDRAHEFKVTAAAPMAGPYALSSSLDEIAGTPSPHSSAEAAILLVAMNHAYGIYKELTEAFVPSVAAIVVGLFDGTHDSPDVYRTLDMKPIEMIQPAFLHSALTDPGAPLNVALRANDVFDWTPDPTIPIHLYHGHGDHEVPYTNSQKAYNSLKAQGANIELINLGDTVDHAQGFSLGAAQAAAWFETF